MQLELSRGEWMGVEKAQKDENQKETQNRRLEQNMLLRKGLMGARDDSI